MTIRFWANKLLHRNQMTVYTRRQGGEAEREDAIRRRIKIDENLLIMRVELAMEYRPR